MGVRCGIAPAFDKGVNEPLCANIGETTLKFLIKLEGLENFDVRIAKKRAGKITGSAGKGDTASFYGGIQAKDG